MRSRFPALSVYSTGIPLARRNALSEIRYRRAMPISVSPERTRWVARRPWPLPRRVLQHNGELTEHGAGNEPAIVKIAEADVADDPHRFMRSTG